MNLTDYTPWPWQRAFHSDRSDAREIETDNLTGKTAAGAFEAAAHATGLYPDWWEGHRFDGSTVGLVAGPAREAVEQLILPILGGLIEPTKITQHVKLTGREIKSMAVRHASGGESVVRFRWYDQDPGTWFGHRFDWGWLDEAAPGPIRDELRVRCGRHWALWTDRDKRDARWAGMTPDEQKADIEARVAAARGDA